MTNEDVVKNFMLGKVTDEEKDGLTLMMFAFSEFAKELNDILPEGRLKSIAMTRLEECSMFAIKSISHK